ncbi:MAG: outer membrane protein assembly factor BamA [Bacteroidota bacterium]
MTRRRLSAVLSLLVVLGLLAPMAQAQTESLALADDPTERLTQTPQAIQISEIRVEGVADENTQRFVLQRSGLATGQTVTIPGDQAFSEAIRDIYDLGLFDDVKIVEEQRTEGGVHLVIRVREVPRLDDYSFTGVKRSHRKDLAEDVSLIRRTSLRQGDVQRAVQVIEDFYDDKGHPLASVDVQRELDEETNTVDVTFAIDKGPRVEVADIQIDGNSTISERKLRREMKGTKEKRWWRFWKKETFNENKYQEDLNTLLRTYNERGYYDARIEQDSVYIQNEEGDPEMIVRLLIHEGPQYHIRHVDWEGNTVYTDAQLSRSLDLEAGEVYNSSKLEENLYGNRQSSDIYSLYTNRGYMRFNAQPTVTVVEGDSLDLSFDLFEGDIYEFGTITIAGNENTKEHVIRRELYTFPGQTFSRELIQESIRRLMQLSYFSQESLSAGPSINLDEANKRVDLAYTVEEVGSDQLQLSGTWGGFGLILQLQFGFNNFSAQNLFKRGAWRPIPRGDGQKLSMGVQTNGRFYQSYSLSFTEPWFRGRPTPVGFALSHSRIDGSSGQSNTSFFLRQGGRFINSSVRLFYDQRLKWPDDKFNSSTGLRYQFYNNEDWTTTLPRGISQEITAQQSFSRNSLDNPMFPQSGSNVSLSLDVAPPIPGFIQYHKWRFRSSWNIPLANKLSFGVNTDYGYIGSLTGDPVNFQRFFVGGSPFETSGGFFAFGSDIVYMRGYPLQAVGPRRNGDEVTGGTILNKYSAELRFMAVTSPQVQAAPYLFFDAANTYDSFQTYNPASLFRAAGVGARLFLPILGMLELSYGYNFDEFVPVNSRHEGNKRGFFQFSLGQGFGQ